MYYACDGQERDTVVVQYNGSCSALFFATQARTYTVCRTRAVFLFCLACCCNKVVLTGGTRGRRGYPILAHGCGCIGYFLRFVGSDAAE